MGLFGSRKKSTATGNSGLASSAQTPAEMQVHEDVIELIGNTPLVRLARIGADVAPTILAKLEYLNPGGSVKDRPALTMIEAAERDGRLKPGGTIVEPTSGNTGVGLAIVAARRGYKCIFTVPDKVAPEKIAQLRAYGAQVVVCPTAVEPDDPRSYYSVSTQLCNEIEGAFKPDQYSNPANPVAHYNATGPEIWEQTAHRVTHVVAGVGTAGTIGGISQFLKEQNKNIQIVGADPEGSVYSGGPARPYLVEGVGEDFFPGNYHSEQIDRVISVSDAESFETARKTTRDEGVFLGGSGGMALAAALKLARDCKEGDVIVVLIPDSGRGYLSKLYNDEWMLRHGFADDESSSEKSEEQTVGDIVESRTANGSGFVSVYASQSVRDAIEVMKRHGVSQVPVVSSADALPTLGEVVGCISEADLLQRSSEDADVLNDTVGNQMASRPDVVGWGENIASAIGQLVDERALMVLRDGRPVAMLTRSDVLENFVNA